MASRIAGMPAPGGWIVLGMLLDRGPQTGYELATVAARSIDHFWPITKAQIYAELPRLERAGFVKSTDIAQEGVPDKRVYKATRIGEEAFRAWIDRDELGETRARNPVLLRIWFGSQLPFERVQAALAEQTARNSKALERYRLLLKQLEASSGAQEPKEQQDKSLFRRLAIRHALLRLEAEQLWLDEAAKSLAKDRTRKKAVRP